MPHQPLPEHDRTQRDGGRDNQRRGVLELPAIAIFTVVAGSLIILFFVAVTQSQGGRAQQATQAESLQELDTLLKTAAAARETANNITIVDDTLVFTCDDAGMRLGFSSHVQLPIAVITLFSTDHLNGGLLRAYTYGSDTPYHAGNVVYLSTDDYVLETPMDLYGYPFQTSSLKLQSGFRKLYDGNAPVGDPGHAPLLMRAGDMVLYKDTDTYGRVEYKSGAGGFEEVVYPNHEMLYGALLSRDKQTYDCVFQRYLDQVKFVTRIQRDRVQELGAQATAAGSSCAPSYQTFPFDEIEALPPAANFTTTDASTLLSAENEIAFLNQKLLLGDNCAPIY